MLFSKSKAVPKLQQRFKAIGKMALTNYIAQSIIGVLLFRSLGLFGEIDRIDQLGIVIGVWLLQVAWSKPWLDKFRFGPLEWLWRSLTYGKWQQMGK